MVDKMDIDNLPISKLFDLKDKINSNIDEFGIKILNLAIETKFTDFFIGSLFHNYNDIYILDSRCEQSLVIFSYEYFYCGDTNGFHIDLPLEICDKLYDDIKNWFIQETERRTLDHKRRIERTKQEENEKLEKYERATYERLRVKYENE